MNTNAIVVLSMFVGSVVIVLFCHKQVGSVAKILEKGVNNGIGATVMAAAILGFSGVLQSCPGFQSIINFVMGLKMNPYLTEFFGLNILAGILGSGTSSIAMFFEHLSDGLLAKGASAGALHRLAPACATGMNTLPNAGGMVATAPLDETVTGRKLLVCIYDIRTCSNDRFTGSSNCSYDHLLMDL